MDVAQLMEPDVVTVRPTATLKDAAALLVRHRISGLPVCTADGRVVGVISQADIVRKELGESESGAVTVSDAMTSPAITIGSAVPVGAAAKLMTARRVNRLPVVDGDRLVGIVTRHDLVRVFDRSDDAIADDIRVRLASPRYTPERHTVTFGVSHGVVTLEGSVYYQSDRAVIEGMARDVPGVVAVDSKLDYLHPDPSLWP